MSPPRRHLLLSATAAGFGEALQGIRLAEELQASGDSVLFLAPSGLATLFRDSPVRYGKIDLALRRLDRAVLEILEKERCDSLVLVDLAAVYKVFKTLQLDFEAIVQSPTKVAALDVWNLADSDRRWDYGPETYQMDAQVLRVTRRLVPVPFIRPHCVDGTYNALPALRPLPAEERAAIRRELGLHDGDRLVLWPSAPWQHARAQQHPVRQRLADALPPLIFNYFAQLGDAVRVLHIGPEPLPGAEIIGPRYRYLAQLEKAKFDRYLASADLLFGCNLAATSIMAALATDVPIVVGVNSFAGDSPAAVEASSGALSANVRSWLVNATPLRPFVAWPLGLRELLQPALRDNPYTEALRIVELLHEEAFIAACRGLLFDDDAASQQRTRQQVYRDEIIKLPRAAERLRDLIA